MSEKVEKSSHPWHMALLLLSLASLAAAGFLSWSAQRPLPWAVLVVVVAIALGGFLGALCRLFRRLNRGESGERDLSSRLVSMRGLADRRAVLFCSILAAASWVLSISVFVTSQGVPYSDGSEDCRYYLFGPDRAELCIDYAAFHSELAKQQALGFTFSTFFLALSSLVFAGSSETSVERVRRAGSKS